MQIDWEINGLKQLDDALNTLSVDVGKKVLRKAARDSMGGVQFAMAAGAGFDPESSGEHMREDIKMSTKIADAKNGGSDNAVVVRVGPSKKHSQKAIAQEYGTEKQSPDPFMRPALFENRERVVNSLKTSLALGIQKAILKGRKR